MNGPMTGYAPEQIQLYFRHIGLPVDDYHSRINADPLGFLTTLMHRHLARIPFDSLALHYSPHRTLSLHPQALFHKLVVRGRGGYCMEVNTFFATVLRTLGYTLYSAGGRVSVAGVRSGWNHMLNLVTINDTRYVVDVGFGSNDALHPIPLKDGEFDLIAPVRGKLEYRALAHHSDPSQRVWVYSVQQSEQAPWEDMYSFVEVEFFPEDFRVMNMTTSSAPQSFFVQNVMCMRVLLKEGTDEPEGVIILHRDYVKRRVGDKVEILQMLETEEDRLKVLQEWFSITLGEDEKAAIRGLPSELRRKPPPGVGHS
jgi:arylamine N-acetyltransferase